MQAIYIKNHIVLVSIFNIEISTDMCFTEASSSFSAGSNFTR